MAINAGLGWASIGLVGALAAVAGMGIFGWALADARSRRRSGVVSAGS